jgi:hypothetical protein
MTEGKGPRPRKTEPEAAGPKPTGPEPGGTKAEGPKSEAPKAAGRNRPRSLRLPELLVCGYARGGTTLLSDILRANGWESGFEGGALLAETAADIPHCSPYWERLAGAWNIRRNQRDTLPLTSFAAFYNMLIRRAFPDAPPTMRFFDKTPGYMERLGQVMARAPFVRKVLVIHRDPRAIFASYAKRQMSGRSLERVIEARFAAYVARYIERFAAVIAHKDRPEVLFVPFEGLCADPALWLDRIGCFVSGAPFVGPSGPSRFRNVYGTGIDPALATEFREQMDPEMEQRILDATALAAPFFMEEAERLAYGGPWRETEARARALLERYARQPLGEIAAGAAFDPLTYLVRYPDALDSGIDPVVHYETTGRAEGRLPL